jgi:hypothetical protein
LGHAACRLIPATNSPNGGHPIPSHAANQTVLGSPFRAAYIGGWA